VKTIVADPVMVSRSGDKLLDDDTIATIRTSLLPLATILTPNRYEAQLLAGIEIQDVYDMKTAARKIVDHGGVSTVLVKGGGLAGTTCGTDVWFDGTTLRELKTEYIDTTNTNGTGCSLSASIAANLANGMDTLESIRRAKLYITKGLKGSLEIGRGKGPICHFHPLFKN
ncbi:MAG: PfkB family carbohydrate kinase, partial [Cyanobacteria bacterium P01_E01_bin.48]